MGIILTVTFFGSYVWDVCNLSDGVGCREYENGIVLFILSLEAIHQISFFLCHNHFIVCDVWDLFSCNC
jgi:hypothetical protein